MSTSYKHNIIIDILFLLTFFIGLATFIIMPSGKNREIRDVEYQELYIMVEQRPALKPYVRACMQDGKISIEEYDSLLKDFKYTNKQIFIESIKD